MADLQRVMDALRNRSDGGAGLAIELNNERASSLGRAGRKLEAAVAACATALAALDGSRESIARFDERREQALEARWEMIVTRECCGMWPHDDVDRAWPIPVTARPAV